MEISDWQDSKGGNQIETFSREKFFKKEKALDWDNEWRNEADS